MNNNFGPNCIFYELVMGRNYKTGIVYRKNPLKIRNYKTGILHRKNPLKIRNRTRAKQTQAPIATNYDVKL